MAKVRSNEYSVKLENYKKGKEGKTEDQAIAVETPVESPKKKIKSKEAKNEESKNNAPIGLVVEQEHVSTNKKEEKVSDIKEEPKSESPKKKKKHSESLDSDAAEKKKLKKKNKEVSLSQQ